MSEMVTVRKDILRQMKMKAHLKGYLIGKEYYLAARMMKLAEGYHSGVRKDGVTPEFYHQINIVQVLRTFERDLIHPEATYIIGFGHDLVEDYKCIEYLRTVFVDEDAEYLDLLCDISKESADGLFPKKNDYEYYEPLARHPILSVVKAQDRLHNLTTMIDAFTLENVFDFGKQEKYVIETENFVFPMIKRAIDLFPRQESVYHNIRLGLEDRVTLIKKGLKNAQNQEA